MPLCAGCTTQLEQCHLLFTVLHARQHSLSVSQGQNNGEPGGTTNQAFTLLTFWEPRVRVLMEIHVPYS